MNIIGDIFRENHNRIFIIDSLSQRSFTYGEFEDLVLAACEYLNGRGIQKGMRVAVCLPNSVEFAALYFCAIRLGFTIVALNTNFNLHELEFILRNCKAEAVIYSKATEPHIDLLCDGFKDMKKIHLLPGFERDKTVGPADRFEIGADTEDLFAVMYTSGTTRVPKGVAHSVQNMIENASVFIEASGISAESRFYNILSMAYMAGFYNLTLLPFLAGASVVIGEAFSPQQALNFWQIPIRHKVSVLWLVPTILSILLKLDRGIEGPDYCRQFIDRVFVGTAPLTLKLRQEFEDKYAVNLLENYGLSETLFISAVTTETSHMRGSVGRVLPGCSVSIVGVGGTDLPFDAEGEIALVSPSLMLGYLDEKTGELNRLDRTKKFYTGDIGYLNSEGLLFISGRKKDLIIKGGINISPQAVENVLMDCEAVERAAIVGIAHMIYGEDVAAVVKVKEGWDFAKVKPLLIEYCRANLSPVQQPSVFFEIEEFPLSSTGKIDKKRIKSMLSEKLKIPGFTA